LIVLTVLPVVLLSCRFRSLLDEGRMVKFDGYKLYVKDRGTGVPTVIIENGLSFNTELYDTLYHEISKQTRVLSYDHAGIGRSTYNGKLRTVDNFTHELTALLKYKKISPPYILVGHSMGGFLIRYFAHLHPDEVAGLVFIEAPHEDWFAYIRSRHTPEELQYFNDFFDPSKRKMTKGGLAELSYYSNICDSIRGKKISLHIPVKMYTGTKESKWAKTFGYDREDLIVWAKMQGGILDGLDDAQQYVDSNSSHIFHRDNLPLVMSGIQDLIQKCRRLK
jgi:pimeloyl-ACP methyl ester carboxylesterase